MIPRGFPICVLVALVVSREVPSASGLLRSLPSQIVRSYAIGFILGWRRASLDSFSRSWCVYFGAMTEPEARSRNKFICLKHSGFLLLFPTVLLGAGVILIWQLRLTPSAYPLGIIQGNQQ